MTALSILDLAPVPEGATPADALARSVALARAGEAAGYRRLWLAEHHNMVGIASAATAVVIAHVAAATSTIRVGAGGVMLPNHAPLVIAEQFGTLATLHPGRIDLGLGRAPGTDPETARALRRDPAAADTFPQDVLELQAYLGPPDPARRVNAVPGGGTEVPLWILGSSTYGAELAGLLGLPFAFASHFAPAMLAPALETYRRRFRPSRQLVRPYAMAGANVFAAPTAAEARRLFTSQQQAVAGILRGRRGRLPAPVDDMDALWTPGERAQAQQWLGCAFVGTPSEAAGGLAAFAAQHGLDEVMVAASIHDGAARLRSYEALAAAWPEAQRGAARAA